MSGPAIFISHTTGDDGFVAELRRQLEDHGLVVWVDSRDMVAGDPITAGVRTAIQTASHFVVVLSPAAISSQWVADEIREALTVQQQRGPGYRVIPLLLPGLGPNALARWFADPPKAVRVAADRGGLQEAMPEILAAVDRRPADDDAITPEQSAPDVADLALELEEAVIETVESKRRAVAWARLVYVPPAAVGGDPIRSRRFRLMAPIGPLECDELAWYLEQYCRWPSKLLQSRVLRIEQALPRWGSSLFNLLQAAVAEDVAAAAALSAWRTEHPSPPQHARRFSVYLDPRPPRGVEPAAAAEMAEAATVLLSMPWELLHDGSCYLFQGLRPVRVRRRLPRERHEAKVAVDPPLRVLLISPRPEDDRSTLPGNGGSARALADALGPLGELVQLQVLSAPTLPALERTLRQAREQGRPIHVVHFDGQGVYDRRHGLGALCFEDPADGGKIAGRRTKLVHADELAAVLKEHRIPLVFLEARQADGTEEGPTAPVAGRLLSQGVSSVVAMSHNVLAEAARRFVAAFYGVLVEGGRVGEAMLTGQRALFEDPTRGGAFSGELRLQDWFVPVLYQEEQDVQLVRRRPSQAARRLIELRQTRRLGQLPQPPGHTFVGRGRELLWAERLLVQKRYVLLRGEGGQGKTALAAEIARWLVASRRFRRAVFVSLETHPEPRAVLDALGRQLVPGFAVAEHRDLDEACLPLERSLGEQDTVMVLDNAESVLSGSPGTEGAPGFEPESPKRLLDMVQRLTAAGQTRAIWTSRERLPDPFAGNEILVGGLERDEAIALVAQVLAQRGQAPRTQDAADGHAEVAALVDAVSCHARSLVLLAGLLPEAGIRATTERLRELMASLEGAHPGERERSLLASVELSLRRLAPAIRERIGPLGAFQGGGHVRAIAQALGLTDVEQAQRLVAELERVGLANGTAEGHVRFDPALGPRLWSGLDESRREGAHASWLNAMSVMTQYLSSLSFKDPRTAYTLTNLDLANLVGAVEALEAKGPPESVATQATLLESLVMNVGSPRRLAAISGVRERATQRLSVWGHVGFVAEAAAIDQLIDRGAFARAVASARALLARSSAAGEEAYSGAPYDLAMAHFVLGRTLRLSGAAQLALPVLAEARRRFQTVEPSDRQSAGMSLVTITETADCLRSLGQLERAAHCYEQAIDLGKLRGDLRNVAVNTGQLGTVRWLQGRFNDALAAFLEARTKFEDFREPRNVAGLWHQIGMVHADAGDPDKAEHAYQESLKLSTQLGDRAGEARTLSELAGLCSVRGDADDAARLYRRAAQEYVALEDPANEGRCRSNAAANLLRLGLHEQAREEISRALACYEPFGHAVAPWTTYSILDDLERQLGNADAASAARARAFEAYLGYRRDGGESTTRVGPLFADIQGALLAGDTQRASGRLEQHARLTERPAHPQALDETLSRIVAGVRDPGLANPATLGYAAAAEVWLLLDSLSAALTA